MTPTFWILLVVLITWRNSGIGVLIFGFIAIGDKLLGGSVCANTPVFFSRNHGLLAVYPAEQAMPDANRSLSMSMSMADASFDDKSMQFNDTLGMQTTNLSLYNFDPEDMLTAQRDTVSQVKAAFLYHVKNQQVSVVSFLVWASLGLCLFICCYPGGLSRNTKRTFPRRGGSS